MLRQINVWISRLRLLHANRSRRGFRWVNFQSAGLGQFYSGARKRILKALENRSQICVWLPSKSALRPGLMPRISGSPSRS